MVPAAPKSVFVPIKEKRVYKESPSFFLSNHIHIYGQIIS